MNWVLEIIIVWWEWMMMMNCWCRLGLRRREWKYREVWWMKKCKRKWKKCLKNIDLMFLLVLILNGDIFGGLVIAPLILNFRCSFIVLSFFLFCNLLKKWSTPYVYASLVTDNHCDRNYLCPTMLVSPKQWGLQERVNQIEITCLKCELFSQMVQKALIQEF